MDISSADLKKGLLGWANISDIRFLTLPRNTKDVSARNCIFDLSSDSTRFESGISRMS